MFQWEFVWLAGLLGVLGGFNFNFQELKTNIGKWFQVWLITAVSYAALLLYIFWAGMPSVVSPYLTIFITLAFLLLASLIIAGRRMGDDSYDLMAFPKGGAVVYGVFWLLFIVIALSGSEMFRAAEHRDLIGEVEPANWTEDMALVDVAHIREVSKEQAQYLADKVLGESEDILGSRYKVGEANVCNVNGEIVWVAPLEFRGFWKWRRFRTAPGYILVSAEDRTRKPVLVDTLKLEYLSSAYWSKNLKRHVYTHGYQGYQLRETSFEIDDSYRPYFTISATKPSIGFGGAKTEGVIVVDPKTGDRAWYDLGEAPSWVDRVIPEEIAESYITKWGKYVHGFWNTVFSELDVIAPTSYGAEGRDVFFVPSPDGRNFWFTGITSSSSDDQALVGVVMMNTQTGQAYRYRVSGANEESILDAVTQALGADAERWMPTQPIPYGIYGEVSFVVPVIGRDKPIFQRLAVVRDSNLELVIGKNKRSALSQYQRLLATSGSSTFAPTYQSETRTVTGEILRIGQEMQEGTTVYSILLSPVRSKLFTLSSSGNPEVLIAESGDTVTMRFLNTDEELVSVNEFDLHGVDLQKSEIQAAYESQVEKSEETLRKQEKRRKAKRSLENLSDEELEGLLRLQKEKKQQD
ncbi:hypothetical protein MYX07_06995 [Patescibacteria group bacterium AH-259-L07]|nr:hypothetical protein [Patescibacteria group bacterium AH-259-L07]